MPLLSPLPPFDGYHSFVPCPPQSNLELVFIDAAVADFQSLLQGVAPGVEVVLLEPDRDGMAQITAALAQYRGIKRLHLVSHGRSGQVELGNTVLTLDRLPTYAFHLRQWRQALSPNATLLIYGCEVASGLAGATLIQQLSRVLGVPVAASDRLVGSATQGGSWELAIQTAVMDARPVFQPAVLESYAHVLSSEIRISDASVTEGNDGTKNITFTVFLSAANLTEPITVDYATEDDSATAGVDYTAVSDTLRFEPGETVKTITVTVAGDTTSEASELFFLNLTNPSSNATIAAPQGIGVILNDDPLPLINVDDVTLAEGNSGTIEAEFTVSLSAASDQFITVNYKTADDTAKEGDDYTSTTGRLIFSPGETTKTIVVPVLGDSLDEIDETFQLNLSGAKNAKLGDGQGTVTITDDDPLPTIRVGNISATEGGNATFTVSLSAASGKTIKIDYSLLDGTATVADQDFGAASGTLTFAPGETSQTVIVPILDDTVYDPNEAFSIELSNPSEVTLGTGQATATLTDNDLPPQISIADTEITEGDNGTQILTFTLSLSNASSQPVEVDYIATDDTATSGEDYSLTPGKITFAPGETSQTLSVTVNGDTRYEADQTFAITLSNPSGGTLLDSTAVGTIRNDDPLPTISISDSEIKEGDSGSLVLSFTVSLSSASDQSISVQYGTANGTAGESDFNAVTGGTLNFAAGETSQTIEIEILGDTLDEANETFQVNLTTPTNATLGDAQATGTITDDDGIPTLSIENIDVLEGDAGTSNAVFTVSLSNASTEVITVNYTTVDDTAKVADNDYQQTSGTLQFAPGETSQTILVPVKGDLLTEPDKAFKINLSGPVNATFAQDTAIATILDNDATLSASIGNIEVLESNSGTVNAVLTVSLSRANDQPVTISFATENGSATVEDGDYQATSGSLTFAAGETSKTIAVPVKGDTQIEADEFFKLNLTSNDLELTDAQGIATIRNDDSVPPLPTLSVQDVSLPEGNAGSSNAVVTIALSAASSQTVSVEYETRDGSATTADGDYSALSRSVLTFAPGETSKTIAVSIQGDTKVESDETLELWLLNPTQATLAREKSVITLQNDDQSSSGGTTDNSDPDTPTNPTNPANPTEPTPDLPSGNDGSSNGSSNDSGNDSGDANNPALLTQQVGTKADEQIVGTDGNDLLRGGGGNDQLLAGEGQDRLYGEAGDDQLYGGRDGDFLSGGPGDDQLFGGRGNDRLTGDAGDDQLYGRGGDDQLLGKTGDDFLGGGFGNDLLIGGLGNDELRGAQGRDQFMFLSPAEKQDQILDFKLGQDQILVSARGFKAGLKRGILEDSQFRLGSRAESSSDRFLYDRESGHLYFDADGSGGSAKQLLAELVNRPNLNHRAIAVVA